MKTIIVYFIFLSSLFAHSTTHNQALILEKIFNDITINKELKLWSDNKKLLNEIKEHHKFTIVEKLNDANIIILENKNSITKKCLSKYIFVLKYKLLTEIPRSFGALFWKKGRPNIVIIKPRAKAQSIKLSEELEPYIEEKVW